MEDQTVSLHRSTKGQLLGAVLMEICQLLLLSFDKPAFFDRLVVLLQRGDGGELGKSNATDAIGNSLSILHSTPSS